MLDKEEARLTLHACGLSEEDEFILALKSPTMWAKALAFIAAAYIVLLIVRAVVCA